MSSPTIAVLADVHGNYLALKACLDYARAHGVRHYLFLGDYITDHAYPQRVMEQLYEMRERFDCLFIRGNREEYMIDYRKHGGKQADGSVWQDCSAQGALLYCYENLTGRDIDWFESLPVFDVWQIEGAPPIACCHGSPKKAKDRMSGGPGTWELLAGVEPELLVKGHVHRHFSLSCRGKRILCTGSVGNPIDRRTRPVGYGAPRVTELAKSTQMTLLHLEDGMWKPEYLRLPYDWQGAIDNLKTSGLWERAMVWAALLRHNVLTGTDPCGVVPSRAAGLYRLDTGIDASWAQVPEAYWRRAADEYGVSTVW